jgi:predicted HicB family RNase H-like nuclease
MTPKQKTQAEYVTVSIRFSLDTHRRLLALAIANNRSINQQVNFMLNQYLMTVEGEKEGEEE